jgi:hypothetical protein
LLPKHVVHKSVEKYKSCGSRTAPFFFIQPFCSLKMKICWMLISPIFLNPKLQNIALFLTNRQLNFELTLHTNLVLSEALVSFFFAFLFSNQIVIHLFINLYNLQESFAMIWIMPFFMRWYCIGLPNLGCKYWCKYNAQIKSNCDMIWQLNGQLTRVGACWILKYTFTFQQNNIFLCLISY